MVWYVLRRTTKVSRPRKLMKKLKKWDLIVNYNKKNNTSGGKTSDELFFAVKKM